MQKTKRNTQYKTAESVTFAHPDKVCDQISDAILDACLEEDPASRVAVETLGGHGMIVVAGEVTTRACINARKIAEDVYRGAGYEDNVGILVNIVSQSPEISYGVDREGAGDQGIMIGYATDETPEMIPLELALARRLTDAMGSHDGKAQVTTRNGKVETILTSICASGDMSDVVLERCVLSLQKYFSSGAKNIGDVWMQNPNGAWTIGGFAADTGLTGRKLAVDNYGPNIPVGGGAFSGKDATKVDRSAAYMARKVAVDYLKKYGASEVVARIAYAIGVAEPLMAVVEIDGRSEKIRGYDLRPRAIIDALRLTQPKFRITARRGHFGNGFAWDS